MNFAAELGGTPFSCTETYNGLGTADSPIQVLDYRMFVSNVALITEDGATVPLELEQDRRWQVETIALLDFEDGTGSCTNGTAETNMTVRGTVPEGNYTGLRFNIGVPFDWNHGDPTLAPSPLNLTAMFWNWRGGYKFIKFETTPVSADGMNMAQDMHTEGAHGHSAASGWFLHLGSTMCQSNSRTDPPESPCANLNVMTVAFDAFNALRQQIVIDPAPVIAASDLTMNTPETSPGCMSFPNDADCATVLPKLGLPFNDISAEAQRLVAVR
ncbi:MbnP family copper-binding protein [Pseudaestuariivita rosea]|uniref:MbnP family copper-binding protein n=1 Tax=Pseudaestuariivita rosea TaxID=2763263 RepID=UPI001F1D3156|nr:MbnP family copper-binding protein [Pseudaestuariivita rosea]